MNRNTVKVLAFLLAIIMVLGAAPLGVFADGIAAFAGALNDTDTVYVLACSDFQPTDGYEAGVKRVNDIMSAIKSAGYTHMDGFLCAGDYQNNAASNTSGTVEGRNILQNTVQAVFGTEMDEVYAQGNHDADSLTNDGPLSPSGANDSENYGVYVINEKDYMWYNDTRSTIEATAVALEKYLNEKVADGYDKPIFVISHLPLHYSMRTYRDGDGQYANYLFDVMNAAGKQGLNIIYLYGHDHNSGWDNYLGAASVYLKIGDNINIAQESKTVFREETLAFTYMNAGFTGYFNNSSIDSTLTMTVFAIKGNRVEINRFDANGLHNLKSKGVLGAVYNGDIEKEMYAADTTVYTSPQIVNEFQTVTDLTGTVTVKAPEITAVTLKSKTEQIEDWYDKYVVYDIATEGYTDGKTAVVTIQLDEGFSDAIPVTVIDPDTCDQTSVNIVDGTVTFSTIHFGKYIVAQVDMSEPVSDTVGIPVFTIAKGQPVSELVNGKNYVLVNYWSGYTLTSIPKGNKYLFTDNTDDRYENTWYCEVSGKNKYLRTEKNGLYLNIGNGQATLNESAEGSQLTMQYYSAYNMWTIAQNSYYLSQLGSLSALNAGGYTKGYETRASWWYVYEYTMNDTMNITLSVAPETITMYSGNSFYPACTVAVNGVASTLYDVSWTSSDPSVVTVADGELKALSAGSATITVTLTSVNGEALDSEYQPQVQVRVEVVEPPRTVDDAVVIDFGTPVDVNVLSNDVFYGECAISGICLNSTAYETGAHTEEMADGFSEAVDQFSIVDGKIRYTPAGMSMTEPAVVYYAVLFDGDYANGYYYGKLTVIPATIMYYEDGFVTYKDSAAATVESENGKWTTVGTAVADIQAEDRVGIAEHVYGYDPMNGAYKTYSNGSAMTVTVDPTTTAPDNSYKNSARASFTFTGTAFDIISLTDSTTDMILITVTDEDGNALVNTMVDNYYGYNYDETNGWQPTPGDDAMWQVPVMKIDMKDYGTYTVTVYVYHNTYFDHKKDGCCTFIMDAIRIYNPAQGNEVAEDAYKADGEYNPTYTVLKEIILSAANLTENDTINGVVFIDGKDKTDVVADYANPGPNNETYLAYGQGVSFMLTADVIPASVQIGVKLACGESATLYKGENEFVTVTTATDMYYVMLTEADWEKADDGKYYTKYVITLANTSKDAVISLTNLKFTQNSAATPAVTALVNDEVIEEANTVMFRLFRTPVEEEIVTEAPTEPETEAPTEPETEPETFEPDYVDTVVVVTPVVQNNNKSSVVSNLLGMLFGKKNNPVTAEPVVTYTANVTVTTSKDVASVTVNGQAVTNYVEIPYFTFERGRLKVDYFRVWNVSLDVESADSEVAVTVSNANGVAYEVQ